MIKMPCETREIVHLVLFYLINTFSRPLYSYQGISPLDDRLFLRILKQRSLILPKGALALFCLKEQDNLPIITTIMYQYQCNGLIP